MGKKIEFPVVANLSVETQNAEQTLNKLIQGMKGQFNIKGKDITSFETTIRNTFKSMKNLTDKELWNPKDVEHLNNQLSQITTTYQGFLEKATLTKKVNDELVNSLKSLNFNQPIDESSIKNNKEYVNLLSKQSEEQKSITQILKDLNKETSNLNIKITKSDTIKQYEKEQAKLEQVNKEYSEYIKLKDSLKVNKTNGLLSKNNSETNKKFREIFGNEFDDVKASQIEKILEGRIKSQENIRDNAFIKARKSNHDLFSNIASSYGISKDQVTEQQLDSYIAKLNELQSKQNILKQTENSLDTLKQQLLTSEQLKNNVQSVLNTLTSEQKNILNNLGINPSEIQTTEQLAEAIEKVKDSSVATEAEIKELSNAFSDSLDPIYKEKDALKETSETVEETVEKLDKISSKLKQLFSFGTAAMVLRRTLRDAFDTIKDLDAAMTETAVVTDFTVGDMWEQLPEYTKMANELGVATKSAYEAATLYYQQGLSTNQVMELSNETLKMARIAGLDAADATDRMTNALRGFNMELNETSAQRIDDVYSELAAITAADVDEISVAMTKTASIASSAGMEFETTAAFLSQIIETTRESAETAGTALKTVIARFTELKKDPNSIVEVEGEEVDANKIETALRSIGVALRDEKGEFRDLDDVFLDVSKKWNTLTTNQQRYVATMAAGSRRNDCCPLLSAA